MPCILQAFKNELLFGLATSKDTELMAQFSVTAIPTLIVLPSVATGSGSAAPKVYRYSGAMNHRSLHAFCKALAAAQNQPPKAHCTLVPGATLFGVSVSELSADAVQKMMDKEKGMWWCGGNQRGMSAIE